ncbi:MAG: TIGR02996 domain-containing protein, partial [Kofleriaceae bacterium]
MASPLLEEILANPADGALRLVYADALLSAGDPRGELIVVDHELARGTGDRIALGGRRRSLLAAHAHAWWPEIPLERLEVRDGFVVRVAATQAELVAASRLFAREPISSVEL